MRGRRTKQVKKPKPKDLIHAASPMRIFFEDEAPRIGSGSRKVHIKVGNKWVRFTDVVTGVTVRKPLKEAIPIILGSIARSSR